MKFYVAGRVRQIEKVREVQAFIKEKGHEINVDWTEHLPPKPYDSDIKSSEKFAGLDINAAMEADVFVLLTDESGAGMYTEFGAAIASNILTNKPKVYVIGDYLSRSMFFFHSKVKRMANIKEVFDDIPLT